MSTLPGCEIEYFTDEETGALKVRAVKDSPMMLQRIYWCDWAAYNLPGSESWKKRERLERGFREWEEEWNSWRS